MPLIGFSHQKSFADLTDREVRALAVTAEEEDSRLYRDIAHGLRGDFPSSAKIFDEMAEEETEHRRRLLDLFTERFGDHIPLIRREDVRGFTRRAPLWVTSFDIEKARHRAETLEAEAANFYRKAAARSTDPAVRKLL